MREERSIPLGLESEKVKRGNDSLKRIGKS